MTKRIDGSWMFDEPREENNMSNEKWTRSRLKAIGKELSGLYDDASKAGHSTLTRRIAQAIAAVSQAQATAEVVVRRIYKE